MESAQSLNTIKDQSTLHQINGGKIIAEGTPEQVAETKGSYTGEFLKNILFKDTMKKTA
jgi:excinuclease ABC subunit A